jgi:hypothetical protein
MMKHKTPKERKKKVEEKGRRKSSENSTAENKREKEERELLLVFRATEETAWNQGYRLVHLLMDLTVCLPVSMSL